MFSVFRCITYFTVIMILSAQCHNTVLSCLWYAKKLGLVVFSLWVTFICTRPIRRFNFAYYYFIISIRMPDFIQRASWYSKLFGFRNQWLTNFPMRSICLCFGFAVFLYRKRGLKFNLLKVRISPKKILPFVSLFNFKEKKNNVELLKFLSCPAKDYFPNAFYLRSLHKKKCMVHSLGC